MDWPVLVFDFDAYPYVVSEERYLIGLAESPHTVDEIVAVFDAAGDRYRVEFTDGAPRLVPDSGDTGDLRTLVRESVDRYPKEFTVRIGVDDIAGLPSADLVRLVCSAVKP